MQRRSRRQYEIITNSQPISAANLPPMSASKPQYQPLVNNGNNVAPMQKPGSELPVFGISGSDDNQAPQPLQPLDFAQEVIKTQNTSNGKLHPKNLTEKERIKQEQLATVADHIARDTAARERAQVEQTEIEKPQPLQVFEPRVEHKIENDEKYRYERVYLPSQGILGYDYVEIRPFDGPELMLLHRVRVSGNESDLFDTIGRCIRNFDVRQLCLGDFRFIFYWLKINSYTRNPFTVRYVSKYGNNNKISLKMSDLKITALDIDDDDIEYFTEKNFCIPTLREAEELNRAVALLPDVTEKDKEAIDAFMYKASYAQYVQGETFAEKMQNLTTKYTPDDWVDIRRFSNIIKSFGVVEQITVKDQHFDADKALEYLHNAIKEIDEVDVSKIQRDDLVDLLSDNRQAIQVEINRINDEISNTGEAAAISETVTFSLSLDAFFPENITA